ncbi:unnamed protein product [Moneuplotes crassus]|uniref:FCP1 homology domain-containing protein n=1 Tax=Euplotes crassus TaxID=5936 RepID=A0AAD1Y3Q9_EUPCR|nr:unnamed protein product [Moneuplotes crassus]
MENTQSQYYSYKKKGYRKNTLITNERNSSLTESAQKNKYRKNTVQVEEMEHFHDCIDKKFQNKGNSRTSRWVQDSMFLKNIKRNPTNSESRKLHNYSSTLPSGSDDTKNNLVRKTFSVGARDEGFLCKYQRNKDAGKKTLVLDLDETLVHSSFSIPNSPPLVNHCLLDVKWEDGERSKVFVRIRPYLQQFLTEMCKIYEVIIFTASVKQYAIPLVKYLDKEKYGFKVLSRAHCLCTTGGYYKDLSKLGREMKDVIIVDNSPQVYCLNKSNGIPIKSWYDDPHDTELFNLIKILKQLSKVGDVRHVIPRILTNDELNMKDYEEIHKFLRGSSPLDDFYKGFMKLKDEFKGFFNVKSDSSELDQEEIKEETRPSKLHQYKSLGLSDKQSNFMDEDSQCIESTKKSSNILSLQNTTKMSSTQQREKPDCVKVIPKLDKYSSVHYKSEKKSKRPGIITNTSFESKDDLVFRQVELLHENFRTEDLSENMCSSSECETPAKTVTPLKTICSKQSPNEKKDYQNILTKSKQKMNRKFNKFRETRMRQSDSLQENDSLGSNSQNKSTQECIDEDIRVKSVSINKGFKKILGTCSKVMISRKTTDHHGRNFNCSVLKDSSNIDTDLGMINNRPLTSRKIECDYNEQRLFKPKLSYPQNRNAEKENHYLESEITHELSISLEVSPSPCKNKVKNFKPTKNISHVENDISNYYTQRKPDCKKDKLLKASPGNKESGLFIAKKKDSVCTTTYSSNKPYSCYKARKLLASEKGLRRGPILENNIACNQKLRSSDIPCDTSNEKIDSHYFDQRNSLEGPTENSIHKNPFKVARKLNESVGSAAYFKARSRILSHKSTYQDYNKRTFCSK